MKVCKDCYYYSWLQVRCTNPKLSTTDIVTGTITHRLCAFVRYDSDACGIDAKLFKEVPSVWVQIKDLLKPGPKFQA